MKRKIPLSNEENNFEWRMESANRLFPFEIVKFNVINAACVFLWYLY